MGHILFAAPSIERHHLHERLARALQARGHHVTLLAGDPVAADFFGAQGLPVRELRPGRVVTHRIPIEEFAVRDCLLAGQPRPQPARLLRVARQLERVLLSLFRLFESDPPDLVLLHRGRSGLHRLVHFLAREYGCGVLHTGEGLLPGTIQCDGEGVDGDSSICRRRAIDYRDEPRDEVFLAAVLSSWIAGAQPPGLARSTVIAPPLAGRVHRLLRAAARGDLRTARRCANAWHAALPRPSSPAGLLPALPEPPFVAFLLQARDDPRLLLDAAPATDPIALATSTARAARRLDASMPIIGVLPPTGLPGRDLARLRAQGLILQPAAGATPAITMALAVATINHPLGLAAILAGTPLVYAGRSPYAMPGVARRTTADGLRDDLSAAIRAERPTLRERFLTRMLRTDHLWCAAEDPDRNGLGGLVARIESQLGGPIAATVGDELCYRAGPAWPLEAGKRDRV